MTIIANYVDSLMLVETKPASLRLRLLIRQPLLKLRFHVSNDSRPFIGRQQRMRPNAGLHRRNLALESLLRMPADVDVRIQRLELAKRIHRSLDEIWKL